jgi:nucleotide-binding universal stress UspA family protein
MNRSRPPILVCHDGSAGAARAIDVAGSLFTGRPAIVVYVWPGVDAGRVHTTSVAIVKGELIEEVRVAARRDAAAIAEKGVDLAREAGLDARPLAVESGDGVVEVISRTAMKESAAAVVIGRGAPTEPGFGRGGVWRRVVAACPVPVLVV